MCGDPGGGGTAGRSGDLRHVTHLLGSASVFRTETVTAASSGLCGDGHLARPRSELPVLFLSPEVLKAPSRKHSKLLPKPSCEWKRKYM